MASVKVTGIIDSTMQKYGIPTWFKPYLFSYARSNPLGAIKHATSFVETRRKKGEITRDHVMLPNGLRFRIGFIEELLSMFYYGEERLAGTYSKWASEPGYNDIEYKKRFQEFSELSRKHMRAIRNLMDGIGLEPKKPKKEVADLFDYIDSTDNWEDRIIISGIIVRYSFSYTFGFVFYKAFYPVASDFMRSFGKTFTSTSDVTAWLGSEAQRLVMERHGDPHIAEFARQALQRVSSSIASEMPLAKSNGIEAEVRLLHSISIAYSLHVLSDLGVRIDVDREVKSIIGKR